MSQDLTPDQLHTLRHMLGINTPEAKVPRPYRNYACTNPGDPKYAELERLGMVERYTPRMASDYVWFRCTEAGRLAAIRSHRTIRYTRNQRRYSRFLDCHECDQDLTFREFLTSPVYEHARREA